MSEFHQVDLGIGQIVSLGPVSRLPQLEAALVSMIPHKRPEVFFCRLDHFLSHKLRRIEADRLSEFISRWLEFW